MATRTHLHVTEGSSSEAQRQNLGPHRRRSHLTVEAIANRILSD